MTIRALILNKDIKSRVISHVLFWLFWYVTVAFSSGVGAHAKDVSNMLKADFVASLHTLLSQIPFCYFIIYFFIPQFMLKRKYFSGLLIVSAFAIAHWYLVYATILMLHPILQRMLGLPPISHPIISMLTTISYTAYSGPWVCLSVMYAFKFLRVWYVKQEENLALIRENITAELQLLKAQVHPHFLFNTLNNIYSFTLTKSPRAGELLEKLFSILHYMIIEGQRPTVPLKDEIQLIEDYISLEMVRYGDRLNIAVHINGNLDNYEIAPLLMIPFVENSFKHGTSRMLSSPRIALRIDVTGNELEFVLENNKPATAMNTEVAPAKGGIGLRNTTKRLQLLYPGKHNLKVESTDTSFVVTLKLTMVAVSEAAYLSDDPSNHSSPVYANS